MARQTDSLATKLLRIERLRAAEDALLRFALGQDTKQQRLLESAFSPDAELDFTHPARHFDALIEPFRGRDEIVAAIVANTAHVRTHHIVSNQRIELNGDAAFGTALVEAQHVAGAAYLLLKNLYTFKLKRSGDDWLLQRVIIELVWHDGDGRVLFPR